MFQLLRLDKMRMMNVGLFDAFFAGRLNKSPLCRTVHCTVSDAGCVID